MYENEEHITLYHGTTQESASELMTNGWNPHQGRTGGQCGQAKYLYLTNIPENALWYAEQKGDDTIIEVEVPLSFLKVDPEDGISDTVLEELNDTHGLPGNVVCFKSILPKMIRLYELQRNFKP